MVVLLQKAVWVFRAASAAAVVAACIADVLSRKVFFERLKTAKRIAVFVLALSAVDASTCHDTHHSDRNGTACHDLLRKSSLLRGGIWSTWYWVSNFNRCMDIDDLSKSELAVLHVVHRVKVLKEEFAEDVLLAAIV